MQNKKKLCNGPCNSLQYIWKNEGGKRYCRRCWSAQSKPNTKPTVRQKRIRPRSSKKIKLDAEYSILRKDFLEKNPLCQARIPGKCSRVSTDVHHTYAGSKRSEYYLKQETWMSVCRDCHSWIHENSKESKIQGYLK